MSESIHRGERAKAILNDPLVKEALETVRVTLRDMFFDLPAHQAKEREFLHMMDRARQQFEGYFVKLIDGMEVSRAELLDEAHMRATAEAARRSVNAR